MMLLFPSSLKQQEQRGKKASAVAGCLANFLGTDLDQQIWGVIRLVIGSLQSRSVSLLPPRASDLALAPQFTEAVVFQPESQRFRLKAAENRSSVEIPFHDNDRFRARG
jgi:hypothetical protein